MKYLNSNLKIFNDNGEVNNPFLKDRGKNKET
jgi:hypothetical protein